MNITSLKISNFLAIGDATIELDNRGLLLIQGINNDDTSTKSNGAGKSSIVDALCWALYGTTARDESGDMVVNDTSKKNCSVVVTLEDGGVIYKISRYRKDATHKNQVFVTQKAGVGAVEVDLSKGTDRETQAVIDAVMGCSLDVFLAAVYSGQERMPDLPGMTDKMLKTLIEEAAGVEILTEAYSAARNRFNKAKAAVDTAAGLKVAASNSKARLTLDLADQSDQSEKFESGRRDRAKAELAGVTPLLNDIKEQHALISSFDIDAIKAEYDECTAKLTAQKSEQETATDLLKKNSLCDREVTRLKTVLQAGKQTLDKLTQSLAEIDSHVGKPCGECGKEYHAADLAKARLAREESIAKTKKELMPHAAALKIATEASTIALSAFESFKATLTDVSAVATLQRDLSAKLNSVERATATVELRKRQVEEIKAKANAKLTEPNPWERAVASKQAELDRADKMQVEVEADLIAQEEKLALVADAVKVFGPAGVRAHILDTVTPYLNDRTREYLGALTDGNTHAVWNTLSTTAKGEVKEKFNIEVTNDKGGKSFRGLSGGEKRKVRLATAMALQDMVASRAIKPIGLLICDEIDDALDEAGLERLMTLLETKARSHGTVLVISHRSLTDWIDNVITVTKDGGYSTIDGAIASGF